MTYYIRYALMDGQQIDLPQLEVGLRQIDPGYKIDEEYVVLDDEEYGLITIKAQLTSSPLAAEPRSASRLG